MCQITVPQLCALPLIDPYKSLTMSASTLTYHPSLNEYAVPDHVYVKQHQEYDILSTGVLVFNKDKKLLLVQRSASEKWNPNVWVREMHQRV